MRKLVVITVIASIMLLVMASAVVYADGHASREVRQRLENMQERIDRGVASGQLTRHESERLQSELRRIRHEFQMMKWDGLSPHERRKLEHDMDRLDGDISRKKHNERRAY